MFLFIHLLTENLKEFCRKSENRNSGVPPKPKEHKTVFYAICLTLFFDRNQEQNTHTPNE